MTSEKRSWYEGATYHITARGHHRNDIFRDEEDFKIYLIILEEALLYFNNYNYEIIAYCLMDNHVHLLLKTGVEPPWRFIAREWLRPSQVPPGVLKFSSGKLM